MSLSKKLRQLAINTTLHGCIGKGKKLLFSSPADLSRFAKFTNGTVLIVGRHTAIQMLENGARVNRMRPLVVISKDGYIGSTHATVDDEKHIYYAPDLKEALNVADGLTLEHNLNGWTVVGGKQVYDEFFGMLGKTSMRLTGAYAFVHDMEPTGAEVVQLEYDWAQMEKLIIRNMANSRVLYNEIDSMGLINGVRGRTKDAKAYFIHDQAYVDPGAINVHGDALHVETTTGPLALDRHFIRGWYFRDGVNSVTLILPNSEITVRPTSEAALNSLLFALNLIVNS